MAKKHAKLGGKSEGRIGVTRRRPQAGIVKRWCSFSLRFCSDRPLCGCAAELYPTPEFSNHPIPQSQTPAPRASWHDWLDLAFLPWPWRPRRTCGPGTIAGRACSCFPSISLAWLGFWRKGCVCPIGAIQNVTQSLLDSHYAAGWMVLAVFVLPLAVTLFFGRSFCAVGLSAGRGAGACGRAAGAGTAVDRSCPGALALSTLGRPCSLPRRARPGSFAATILFVGCSA